MDLQEIADHVLSRYSEVGLPALPQRDQTFFLVWSYFAMLMDGGYGAVFENSPADHFPETLAALQLIGLTQHAANLDSAAQRLFSNGVPSGWEERLAAMQDASLEDLNSQAYGDESPYAHLERLAIWWNQQSE